MQALLEVLPCPGKEPGVLASKAPISALGYAEIALDGTRILEKRRYAACHWDRWGGGQCVGRWRWPVCGEAASVWGGGKCGGRWPMCGEAASVRGGGQCVGRWPMCGEAFPSYLLNHIKEGDQPCVR